MKKFIRNTFGYLFIFIGIVLFCCTIAIGMRNFGYGFFAFKNIVDIFLNFLKAFGVFILSGLSIVIGFIIKGGK